MVKREIPLNILRNILLRVPSKCVLRSKAVSKHLNDLVSDPLFIKEKHRQEQLNPNFLKIVLNSSLTDDDTDKEKHWSFTFTSFDSHGRETQKFTKQDVAFTGRSDAIWLSTMSSKYGGLICIHAVCVLIDHSYRDLVYVCNPVTRQLELLPQFSPSFHPLPQVFTITQVAFGYSPLFDEYKIVRFFFTEFQNDKYTNKVYDDSYEILIGEYEISCEIVNFSGSHNRSIQDVTCWKVIEDKCPYILSNGYVFVNNCFYWYINENLMRSPGKIIIILDTISYKFSTRPNPNLIKEIEEDEDEDEDGERGLGRVLLIELADNLGIYEYKRYKEMINLYRIEDYENWIWKKVYTIDFYEHHNDLLKQRLWWGWPHIRCIVNDRGEVVIQGSIEDVTSELFKFKLYHDTILSLS